MYAEILKCAEIPFCLFIFCVCVCVCVCVRKLMSAIEGKIWAEGVRELVAEQDIEIKGEEVTDWRKFHNEHLHDLYSIHCVLVWRSDQ